MDVLVLEYTCAAMDWTGLAGPARLDGLGKGGCGCGRGYHSTAWRGVAMGREGERQ